MCADVSPCAGLCAILSTGGVSIGQEGGSEEIQRGSDNERGRKRDIGLP